ncbi:MAG: hypothetical protein FJX80_07405 [Bacteroidetes bacterium]|nr:hypothetical protein [Bacteroidota bacterium]
MRRKIGIGLLIILNLTFIYVVIMGAILSYGIIVAPLGQDRGLEIANLTTNDILIKLYVISTAVLLINYFLTRKMIVNKRPFLTSLTITVIGIVVFIPFFLSARQSFLDYQNGTTQLQHYLDRQTITEAQIITDTDTIQVEQLDDFISDIGFAKYKRGPWKYAKTIKLMFKRTDGSKDSLFTNGQMFGAYKGKYFSTDQNVIDKYIDK